ncbi:hypothetical protein FRB96_009373 [Tulasnella sp. 330]|nr:hypothetical protein FRB96_009373 [Tulasnella sp. 330]KAG8871388.1 hypothetical protein FRB97_008763 [Tulasnella sp. 331]KAG8872822.1 hypothetical protein FRB98_009347 [Tulasnella sp. 332]
MPSSHDLEADPLRAALDSAFTQPISLPSTTPSSPSIPPPVPVPTSAEALMQGENVDTESAPPISEETWKEQYDAYVKDWRTASAVAREKAQDTRERFESVRAQEEKEQALKAAAEGSKGNTAGGAWEDVHPGRQPLPASRTSPADARDLVSGEREGHYMASHGITTNESSPPASTLSHEHWEDVPSMASSFPSLPSHEASPPPRHREQEPSMHTDSLPPSSSSAPDSGADDGKGNASSNLKRDLPGPSQARAIPSSSTQLQPPAVTPLIFSHDIPVRTRALALISSLAINMFLPFVNGVMLGFGEIFARDVLAPWIGWKSVIHPGGIRTLRPKLVTEAERLALHRRDHLHDKKEDL